MPSFAFDCEVAAEDEDLLTVANLLGSALDFDVVESKPLLSDKFDFDFTKSFGEITMDPCLMLLTTEDSEDLDFEADNNFVATDLSPLTAVFLLTTGTSLLLDKLFLRDKRSSRDVLILFDNPFAVLLDEALEVESPGFPLLDLKDLSVSSIPSVDFLRPNVPMSLAFDLRGLFAENEFFIIF